MYICPICKNKDERYLGVLNGKQYCRKCISFKGNTAVKRDVENEPLLNMSFDLSPKQQEISNAILKAYYNKQNTFLYAVTGAGKTELVFQTMLEALKQKKRVGFVVPRKDVVIDLFPRIEKSFLNCKVVSLYGGHTKQIEGDIVILTTHQLFRFKKYFNYLIFDEIDAFPYKGNDVLERFFFESLDGNYIMMSATPDKNIIDRVIKDNGVYLTLKRRYHNVDLPVPKIRTSIFSHIPFLIFKLKEYKKNNKQCFVFTPTINDAESLFDILKLFVKGGEVVHSKKENRNQIISDFKNNKYDYLVTTSILERGVTVKNLQVIIYHSDHKVFDSSSLIQISGRVGRKIDAPKGEVWFLCNKKTEYMINAVNTIHQDNLCGIA